MKTWSEHFSSFIIWFVLSKCCISLSTFSVRWSGTLRPLCWYGEMSCFSVDLAMWFLDFPKGEHRCGNLFMIFISSLLSKLMLLMCVPLFCESMNPSFPRISRPIRFTVFALTTRFSLFVASRSQDRRFICIIPVIGISMLLKHLYWVWPFVGSFHLADLHFCIILSASVLQMKLRGLPVSASQFVSNVSVDVLIQISSEIFGDSFCGCAWTKFFGCMRFTVFQLSNTSWV